jgi:outer membrane receptor for ferrienterochelin and colicins
MKVQNLSIISTFMFLFIISQAFAHNHTLLGKVMGGESGLSPISGATVKLLNTALGAKTSAKGDFQIKRVPDGEFEIRISCVGYELKTMKVKVEHNSKDKIDLGEIKLVESTKQTSEIVVTATKSEKVYEDVPVKISVVNDKVFENTASATLKEGLSFQPGLRIETNCQNCGFSQLRLNGLEGKYSQILIDGKAIYSSLNGVYGLDQLPTSMIDRVEIIRGGGSSLYGGNAIAGVVNIITKTPMNNTFKVGVTQSYTDADAPDNSIQLSGALVNEDQNLGLFIFGSSRKRDEWDANGDGFTELGRMNVKSLGGNIFYKPSYLSKITLEYHTLYHMVRGGDSLNLPPHQSNITEMTQHNTNVYQLQYEQYIGGTSDKFSIYGSHQNTRRDSYYGAHKDLNAYGNTDNDTWAAGFQYNRVQENFAGTHILTFGYEYNYDMMKDRAPAYNRIIDQEVYSHGAYLQDDWEISNWFDLVLGARFDKHNLIDNLIVSPRANALFKVNEDLSIRTSVSTGYRAPQAFDEDLHITQVGGEGVLIRLADDLKPEYSLSFSGSIDYVFHLSEIPIGLSFEFFNTKLSDAFALVDQGKDALGNRLMLRKNGESATVRGITFEIQSTPSSNFDCKAGVTLQSSEYNKGIEWSSGDADKGIAPQYSNKILRTPDFYGYFTANYSPIQDLKLNLSGVYTGAMYVPHLAGGIDPDGNEVSEDVLLKSKAFLELNAKLAYKIFENPGVEIFVGVQNMLNQFQDDFDRGANRDASFMYGPGRPLTVYFGVQSEM